MRYFGLIRSRRFARRSSTDQSNEVVQPKTERILYCTGSECGVVCFHVTNTNKACSDCAQLLKTEYLRNFLYRNFTILAYDKVNDKLYICVPRGKDYLILKLIRHSSLAVKDATFAMYNLRVMHEIHVGHALYDKVIYFVNDKHSITLRFHV